MIAAAFLGASGSIGSWSWNLLDDWHELTRYPFMRNALWAALAVGVLCGLVGWFVVLRQESFLAHALALIAFPGAAGAAALGLPLLAGYVSFAVGGAVAISALTPAARTSLRHGHSAAVGSVLAAALGLGFLFVSLYGGLLSSLTSYLFGSFLGITATQAAALFVIAAVVGSALVIARRPLLWASVDPEAASGAGLPIRAVSTGFVVVMAVAVAVTSQLTGALLVFALLVAPAATAQVITPRPAVGLLLSVGFAVGTGWAAAAASYFTTWPVGWWVTTIGLAGYLLARLAVAAAPALGPAVTALLAGLGPLSVDEFQRAFVVGTAVAVVAGLTGWFVVLRNQVFAADALTHTAFTGGMVVLAVGGSLRLGIYGGTVAMAVVFAVLGDRMVRNDVATGIIFAWVLGLGALANSAFLRGGRSDPTTNGAAAVRVLFGSVLGIDPHAVAWAVIVCVVVAGGMVLLARPLLFSVVDPVVARAAGVPTRLVSVAFLVLLGLAVAQATQVVGALLVLGLIATPAAMAARLTPNPWRGMALSVGIAFADVWVGLWLSYLFDDLPPSFVLVGLAFAGYVVSVVVTSRRPALTGSPLPARRR